MHRSCYAVGMLITNRVITGSKVCLVIRIPACQSAANKELLEIPVATMGEKLVTTVTTLLLPITLIT